MQLCDDDSDDNDDNDTGRRMRTMSYILSLTKACYKLDAVPNDNDDNDYSSSFKFQGSFWIRRAALPYILSSTKAF